MKTRGTTRRNFYIGVFAIIAILLCAVIAIISYPHTHAFAGTNNNLFQGLNPNNKTFEQQRQAINYGVGQGEVPVSRSASDQSFFNLP